jgi:hypothetical protein
LKLFALPRPGIARDQYLSAPGCLACLASLGADRRGAHEHGSQIAAKAERKSRDTNGEYLNKLCAPLSLISSATKIYNIMLKTFLLFTMIASASVEAQPDSWTVSLNKKVLLSANKESEQENIAAIKKSDIDKIGELEIVYNEANPNTAWKRTIGIFDENDKPLFEKAEILQIKISTADLRKLVDGKTKIKIYTWAIPKDPAKAAAIRIRRVHLCTLEIK